MGVTWWLKEKCVSHDHLNPDGVTLRFLCRGFSHHQRVDDLSWAPPSVSQTPEFFHGLCLTSPYQCLGKSLELLHQICVWSPSWRAGAGWCVNRLSLDCILKEWWACTIYCLMLMVNPEHLPTFPKVKVHSKIWINDPLQGEGIYLWLWSWCEFGFKKDKSDTPTFLDIKTT